MNQNSRHRLGAIAIKYNVGIDTLVGILKEKGFTEVQSNPNYILSGEQYAYIDTLFVENLRLKQQVIESRKEEMIDNIVNLFPSLVDILNINEKIKNLSQHRFSWKKSEVQSLVKNYLDSLPKEILDHIKTHNLIKKDLLNEMEYLLDEEVVVKKLEKTSQLDDIDFDPRDKFDDGPYCGACQQAPCMCSDPEKTSMTFWS